MTTAVRKGSVKGLLLSALLLPCLTACAAPRPAVQAAKLSPSNAVFDLQQEGLKMLWRAELGNLGAVRIAAVYPVGPLVAVESPAGEVHVLDATTGRWKTVHTFRHGLDCPPAEEGGKLLLASQGRLYEFDPESGALGDPHRLLHPQAVAPLVEDGSIILAAADAYVERLTLGTFESPWGRAVIGTVVRPVLAASGRLYLLTPKLTCLDLANGGTLWDWQPEGTAKLTTDLALAGDAVYVGDSHGEFHALGAANGDTRWDATLPAPLTGSPVCVQGKVLAFTSEPALVCLDAASSEKLWTYPGAVRVLTTGAQAAYVRNADGSVAAVELKSGRQMWRDPLPVGLLVVGHPDQPTFYVASPDGSMVAFQELD